MNGHYNHAELCILLIYYLVINLIICIVLPKGEKVLLYCSTTHIKQNGQGTHSMVLNVTTSDVLTKCYSRTRYA